MAFSEGLSDDGELTGRGNPVTRGLITGFMTFIGGFLHTLPFLIHNVHTIGGNVAKSAEIDALFAETKKRFGKVDVLVNNAGIYAFAPLEGITEESIDSIFGVNVKGLLLSTKAASHCFQPRVEA